MSHAGHDFTALFERLRARVLGLCTHVCGSAALGEDATQDTFVAVHRLLAEFRGEASIETWVYRIALRTALRAKGRAQRETALDGAPEASMSEPHEARDEARRVLRALAALPAEQRAVLALFAMDGLSHAEIAQILAVPVGTIWSRLHAARKKLAAALEEGLAATASATPQAGEPVRRGR